MIATKRDTNAAAIAFDSTPKRIWWREVFQEMWVRWLSFIAYSTRGQDHISTSNFCLHVHPRGIFYFIRWWMINVKLDGCDNLVGMLR